MPAADKPKRRYDASRRQAAALARKERIVAAAKQVFEEQGWGGATMRGIAKSAGASPKTVEALFGTKAALLQTVVEYAIRGDLEPVGMPERPSVQQMEAVPDAAGMVALHAAHLRVVNARSARVARVVEQAASGDAAVAALWARMNENRAFGVRWAAATLLAKPGRRARLTRRQAETSFWVALDWATFVTLTDYAGMSHDEYEAWLRRYYADTLLERGAQL